MALDLLNAQPVADDYLLRLRADLASARIVRFAVAFISGDGLSAIGESNLLGPLRHPESFGLATLSCACGFEPLVALQRRLGDETERLRYFLDPQFKTKGEPFLELMHTKLVYIVRHDDVAVIYTGSHNWSRRALGPGRGTRNVEASMRFELPFTDSDLRGSGTGFGATVNSHLEACYQLGASLPATSRNRPTFEEWRAICCEPADRLRLAEYCVVSTVCSDPRMSIETAFWQGRASGSSVYIQLLSEEEGNELWLQGDRIVVLAWPDPAALAGGRPPVLVFARSTTRNAGSDSSRAGTNQGEIAGFNFVIWDPVQHGAVASGRPPGRPQGTRTRSGTVFDYFTLDLHPARQTSQGIDGPTVEPLYQHYLVIEDVIVPDWFDGDEPGPRWRPPDMAFSDSKTVSPQRLPGYQVLDADRRRRVAQCLEELGADPRRSKAWPANGQRTGLEGRKVSRHPLHEAFFDEESGGRVAAMAAESDFEALLPAPPPVTDGGPKRVPRVQRLYAEGTETLKARFSGRERRRREAHDKERTP